MSTETISATEQTEDGQHRCRWCLATPLYVSYHDKEWGFPVGQDQRLFEKLCLEGFQSGLSWLTILNKRENFRAGFAGFDIHKVAQFGEADVERLLQDAGIVRHRGKIEAVINNAKRAIEMVEAEGSLAAFFWRYAPKQPSTGTDVQAQTGESQALSKELKKLQRFFKNNLDFYKYYRSNNSFVDEKFFVRGKHDIRLWLDTFYFEADHRFSTSHDYKVAKIIANDLIQVY